MDQLLDALGGNKAVAEALAVNPNVVANWRLPGRSIPWRRRPVIAKMAEERGVDLPENFWIEDAA